MSIEVSPYLAHDPEQTLVEVRRFWHAIDRPNLTVKIPSTPAGLPDIRRALSAGINSNISVMFSLQNSRQEYDRELFRKIHACKRIPRRSKMSFDLAPAFSEIVEIFLAHCCQVEEGLHVSDRRLFQAFHAFWRRVAPGVAPPALLGQFRVELTERGYQSSSAKRPHWCGLALRADATHLEQEGDAARSDGAPQGEGSALPNQDAGAGRMQPESLASLLDMSRAADKPLTIEQRGMDQLAAILRKKEESMSNQEGMREQQGRPVGSPLASLEFTRRNFDNPALEWRRLLSEILGTFLLVLTAAGTGVVDGVSHGQISRAAAVTAPGLMVLAIILFMEAISGAHLNPAVSIAFSKSHEMRNELIAELKLS